MQEHKLCILVFNEHSDPNQIIPNQHLITASRIWLSHIAASRKEMERKKTPGYCRFVQSPKFWTLSGYTSGYHTTWSTADIMPMHVFKCTNAADKFAEYFTSGGSPQVVFCRGPRIWSYATVIYTNFTVNSALTCCQTVHKYPDLNRSWLSRTHSPSLSRQWSPWHSNKGCHLHNLLDHQKK